MFPFSTEHKIYWNNYTNELKNGVLNEKEKVEILKKAKNFLEYSNKV